MGQRERCHLIAERVNAISGIDDKQMIEFQIGKRNTHGLRKLWSVYTLALYPDAPSILEKQQVQFCAAMRGPKVFFIGIECFDDLFNHIAFPRGTAFRVNQQIAFAAYAQHLVQNTRISKIYFG